MYPRVAQGQAGLAALGLPRDVSNGIEMGTALGTRSRRSLSPNRMLETKLISGAPSTRVSHDADDAAGRRVVMGAVPRPKPNSHSFGRKRDSQPHEVQARCDGTRTRELRRVRPAPLLDVTRLRSTTPCLDLTRLGSTAIDGPLAPRSHRFCRLWLVMERAGLEPALCGL
jgi:hypothetical protein